MSDRIERKFGDLTVVVDRGNCISTVNCINARPETFVLDEDNICAFTEGTDGVDEARLTEACESCPVAALTLIAGDGRQIVPRS